MNEVALEINAIFEDKSLDDANVLLPFSSTKNLSLLSSDVEQTKDGT